MTLALQAAELRKSYGSIQALKGVSVEVGEGELVGLLGPNGAGKSTLVKIACGLVRPTAGAATIAGADAGGLGRGPRRARWAAGRGRARRRGGAARRDDVEGHAAAARDRAGHGRRPACAPARRADERARPRRA